ncbi:hypothetical protein ENBRE01_3430 [Enteropsectra breve]|nr:hypothetical protein ENBRE01_3430 [Enteropsectra breve]
MVYMLLSDKSEVSYIRAFTQIKNYSINEPERIICDFEIGLTKSLRIVFENSLLKGSNFHFRQAILGMFKKIANCKIHER